MICQLQWHTKSGKQKSYRILVFLILNILLILSNSEETSR